MNIKKSKEITSHNHGIPVLTKALFLDLDGTVRRSKSGKTFIKNPGDVEIIPGIEEKIWNYRNEGYLILGVSNQGGVAFGFKTMGDIENERDATVELFNKNPFHFIKQSLFHPEGNVEPYCHRSLFRKPEIGMIAHYEWEMFERGYVIDLDNSLFVGDRPEDEECAKRAAIPFKHIDQFLNEEPEF